MRRILLPSVLLALAAVPRAHAQAPTRAPAADTLPFVTLPPAMDRVLRDYERAWRARDAAGLAALFTEDGFVLAGGRPPSRGTAAIERPYATGGGPLELRALAYAESDTVGYIIGTYGPSTEELRMGKFVLLLRRAPGGPWRIAADMDNPNQRQPGPRPAPTP